MNASPRDTAPEGTRPVCICADDFGMGHAINEAVLALVEHERLSAVGCMVRRAAWSSAREAPGRTFASCAARGSRSWWSASRPTIRPFASCSIWRKGARRPSG